MGVLCLLLTRVGIGCVLCLQVCEALQVESQADVMHRELESCLSLEYTADSLPPLLHQVTTAQTPGEWKNVIL